MRGKKGLRERQTIKTTITDNNLKKGRQWFNQHSELSSFFI